MKGEGPWDDGKSFNMNILAEIDDSKIVDIKFEKMKILR